MELLFQRRLPALNQTIKKEYRFNSLWKNLEKQDPFGQLILLKWVSRGKLKIRRSR